MIKHTSPISGVDSFGGEYVATAGYDNQVILWDARTKKAIARACHDHLANQCRFSRCGTMLASASSDYTARLWRIPEMRIAAVFCGHDDDVEMAAISPDGGRVATASRDHTIGVFRNDGTMERRLCGHAADVLSVEWTRAGEELVSSSDDGTVRRWSPRAGQLLETVDLGAVETDTIAVSEHGVIYAGDDEGRLVIVDGRTVRAIRAHRAGIKRVVYDHARRFLLTASYDRTIKLWSSQNGSLELLLDAEVPLDVWLRACAFHGNDELVFGTFGSSYATFSLNQKAWDLANVEQTSGLNAVRIIGGHVYSVGDAGVVFRDGVARSRPGSLCNFLGSLQGLVVTGGQAGILFNADTGEALYTHHSPLNCSASFTRDGVPHLLVGTYTGEGLVFSEDARGAVCHLETVRLHDNAIKGVAANDAQLFSVCATGAAKFHDLSTFECVRAEPRAHRKISNGAAVLPDGRFASVSRDLSLRIWSRDACEEVATPHTHSIKCLAVSPRGTLIATGSYDGVVATFDWRERRWRSRERLTAAGVSSLASKADPDAFLASSYDGRIYAVGSGS